MAPGLCTACGTQYRERPARCLICEDARQFVPPTGQAWTTPEALAATHVNGWRRLRPDLFALRTEPAFAIGQRALLLRTPHGNLLWDCLALLDAATVDLVAALGGLAAIAISHPHYYTAMNEWARAFGCPVWLHEADRAWVAHDGGALRYWRGAACEPLPGITLLRVGGHFPGGTVLHSAAGSGTLLSGDVLQVVPDRAHVSFMYSYPNYLPLPASAVERIVATLDPFDYDSVYGSFANAEITSGARLAVARSAERYRALLDGRAPPGANAPASR
ncbi:hypothetical protein [Burkholderia perseverans]|uniref:hypothetical protein n=1 Tax=Burkholderia perseverans TaxID=2615214 RepID=UPI001FEEE60E|nr:hypothetical protein [Burkholderia perseverans]